MSKKLSGMLQRLCFESKVPVISLHGHGAHLVAQMVKNPPSEGDPGLIPGSGRSPGEGNGYPLQYACLENPMDRGAWWATSPRGRKESDTTE